MIAGQVNDARALAGLAQQLLHHVVVGLWASTSALQSPAVDDVADEIDRFRFMDPEKVEELIGL